MKNDIYAKAISIINNSYYLSLISDDALEYIYSIKLKLVSDTYTSIVPFTFLSKTLYRKSTICDMFESFYDISLTKNEKFNKICERINNIRSIWENTQTINSDDDKFIENIMRDYIVRPNHITTYKYDDDVNNIINTAQSLVHDMNAYRENLICVDCINYKWFEICDHPNNVIRSNISGLDINVKDIKTFRNVYCCGKYFKNKHF